MAETRGAWSELMLQLDRHAEAVDHVKERVPEGTRRISGPLWITPNGELVVQGFPHGDDFDADPDDDAHNCDAMGCGSLDEHIIARGVFLTSARGESDA